MTLSSFLLANRRKEVPLYDVPLEVGPQFGYAHALQGKCPLALAICVAAGVCVCGAREAQMRGDDLQQVQPVAHQCVCASVCLCACVSALELVRICVRACVHVSVHHAVPQTSLCLCASKCVPVNAMTQ